MGREIRDPSGWSEQDETPREVILASPPETTENKLPPEKYSEPRFADPAKLPRGKKGPKADGELLEPREGTSPHGPH